ncbi:MAG: hypothetical protein II943_09440 [Victivallales bacterium]|nr:hypothetical protein [Victivallales bacterium]
MTKSRNIFVLNLLLCVAIVAVVAVALARRHAPPVQVPPTEQAAISDVHPAVIPKSSVEDWDDTATLDAEIAALRDEIAELREMIAEEDSKRLAAEAELNQKISSVMQMANQRRQADSTPPVRLTLEELLERQTEFPRAYENVSKQIRLEAEERILARQIIREHLDETTLTEEQLGKVHTFLDQLDIFDCKLSIQNYHPEDFPDDSEQCRMLIANAFAEVPKITLPKLINTVNYHHLFFFPKEQTTP